MAQVNANPALVERFSKAIMAARNLSERAPNLLTQPQKLKLYALFQQASKGPPPSEPPPPGTVNDLDHAKWEAWRDVRAISNQQAMESYSQIIENLEELEVAPQVTATVWSTAAIGVGAGDKLDVPLVFDATSRCTYSFSIVSGSGPVGFRINTVPPQPAPLLSLYESTAEGTLEVLGPALLMVTLDNSAATFNSVELRCRVCLEPIAALAEESRYKMRKAMYEKVLERAAAADGLAKAARMQREAVDKAATRLEELRRAVSSARSELTGLVSTLRAQKMELALGKRELQTLKRTLREKVAQK
ncbi:acyl-CoA-binding protein [Chrysochromulina tobinii]|uniref:Acyl-CoA-binding protein n=1 Tax=Chrysochromulina tobinii TaxID=1460289 RepID=A0A0M0K2F4_9EUKA|nr:acyl-CoA-binding protein [Chrysochromulina tobinii]|eukprot:KOO32980.1 acyl-CoA-binding protein [Chrysochromulina sp. CCMP291]